MKTTGAGSTAPGYRGPRTEYGLMTGGVRSGALVFCLVAVSCLFSAAVPAQEDALRLIEEKRLELKEKEDAQKQEEQRLTALRKEIDKKIQVYTELLIRVETALKRVEYVKGDKIENVVKAYEVMPAEDAAARIAALDEDTALLILTRMKSKKAGAVIALIEPRKAATLTKSMTILKIKK
jgi:flagellar motility protein MotE (MotC chaperone)